MDYSVEQAERELVQLRKRVKQLRSTRERCRLLEEFIRTGRQLEATAADFTLFLELDNPEPAAAARANPSSREQREPVPFSLVRGSED